MGETSLVLLHRVIDAHMSSGGSRGCGSSWIYDGGALVRKSVCIGLPIIMVTIKYVFFRLAYISAVVFIHG
ncbi:hypothetical protein BDR03DRAFT_960900 [Suillus americanus]|nr:hypothetical protein BDR03DRAFT_960900 [Suillus americanus]